MRARSPVGAKYDVCVNRESADEILSRRTVSVAQSGQSEGSGPLGDLLWGT